MIINDDYDYRMLIHNHNVAHWDDIGPNLNGMKFIYGFVGAIYL